MMPQQQDARRVLPRKGHRHRPQDLQPGGGVPPVGGPNRVKDVAVGAIPVGGVFRRERRLRLCERRELGTGERRCRAREHAGQDSQVSERHVPPPFRDGNIIPK